MFNIGGQEQIEFRGPERFNNNDFMSQFHDIYYKGAAERIQVKEQAKSKFI